MSKKILSIALAVVMLFSVLACTAGAANTTVTTTFPSSASQGGFRLVTDAYVGMPAGEQVNVKFYWVHHADVDYDSWLQSLGNIVIAYDTNAYTYNTDNDGSTSLGWDGRTWGDFYTAYFKDEANVNCGSTISNTIINAVNATDEASYGWNKAMVVQPALSTSSGTTQAKGFPVDPTCEVFTLSFTTNKDIEASDVIGIPTASLAKQTVFAYSTGSARKTLTAANIINNEFAVPAVVAGDDTATAKMRPGTADGTVDLGLTGTVLSASFDAGKTAVLNGAGDVAGYTANNLANVGVQARVNGVVSAAEGTCVYDTGDGFNYRAAITGIDAAGLGANIEVRTYITDVNGNTYFSNWMYIDAATVHENAVGNGMTGIA